MHEIRHHVVPPKPSKTKTRENHFRGFRLDEGDAPLLAQLPDWQRQISRLKAATTTLRIG
jgi:hypothetical protein